MRTRLAGTAAAAVLASSLLPDALSAQYFRQRYPTGWISGELTYVETTHESSNSVAVDSVSCSMSLKFFANGWMTYSYSYRRIGTQTWDYSKQPAAGEPFRMKQKRVSYYSGDLKVPADRGPVPAGLQAKRRRFADSTPGNQRLVSFDDGSIDFQYTYPGRIPLVMVKEEIYFGWDGRRVPLVTPEWQESTAHCDPYIKEWVPRALSTSRGQLPAFSGSVDKTVPGTNRRIVVVWDLKPPPPRR